MGALQNVVTLMADPTWKQWLTAAAVINARAVYVEDPETTPDHAVRLLLAQDVAMTPDLLTQRLLTVVTSDPDVSAAGDTPAEVTEEVCIAKVGAYWTFLARWSYPTAP